MPRNSSGVYSLPAGSTAVDGLTAEASVINIPFTDLVSDANAARPIVAGGTGATTAAAALTNLGAANKSANDTVTGDWTFSGTVYFTNAIDFPASAVVTASIAAGAVTRAKIADAAMSGNDATLITGTAGASGKLAAWNADGDLIEGPGILDEDALTTDSATQPPSQQSVKAYVDARVPEIKSVAGGTLNGTGTPAWTWEGGFSSTVTDNGVGDYSVAFSTAQADTNYGIHISVIGAAGVSGRYFLRYANKATGGFDIIITDVNGAAADLADISVLVFRAV